MLEVGSLEIMEGNILYNILEKLLYLFRNPIIQ